MLVSHYMTSKTTTKGSKLRGHTYYREEPYQDDWWYDRFGREPELGDYFVYTTIDQEGKHRLHLGCVYMANWFTKKNKWGKIYYKKYVLYYAKIRGSKVPYPGEKLVETMKNGLSVFSPFYELVKIRQPNGIFLLKPEMVTSVLPHIS